MFHSAVSNCWLKTRTRRIPPPDEEEFGSEWSEPPSIAPRNCYRRRILLVPGPPRVGRQPSPSFPLLRGRNSIAAVIRRERDARFDLAEPTSRVIICR